MMTKRVGEGEERSRLVPPWLEPLLATPFFSPCPAHGDAARGECNLFCLDCPAASSFCFYCRTASHADHRVIQIRRSSYHDVVRVSEVQRALDVGGVQTYVINSARVVFLNERPQPRGGSSSFSSGAGGLPSKSAAHACEICARTLLDPFRFCSLGCKLQAVKRNGDASFVLDDDGGGARGGTAGGGEDVAAASSSSAAAARRRLPDRRQRAGEGGGSRDGTAHAMRGAPTPPPPSNPRRRKGIPRRSPLAP